MTNSRFTLKKNERIASRKLIDQLFAGSSSHSLAAFPVRVVYIIKERAREETPVQVLVSVSKRHFRHAVDRNRAKRQLREAWRHHKETLASMMPADKCLAVAFLWLSDSPQPSAVVESRVSSLVQRIAKHL